MSLAYKSGQGYWTRLMTAIGAGTLVAATAMWLAAKAAVLQIGDFEQVAVQGTAFGIVVLIGVPVVLWLTYGSKKAGEFLIAVEGEMKKVNWSTRKEIFGATNVVIVIALLFALFLLFFDLIFASLFAAIGLLEIG